MSVRHVLVAALAGCLVALAPGSAGAAGSPNVVISQVYGGGGNTGAPYQNDFVELFNRGTASIDLGGWSVQYTSATGTGNFGSAANLITPLSGSIPPGAYVLVQEASGGANGAPLPTADVTDATPINMSATGGKVALVDTTTPLGCNGASTPCSPAALATIVDLLGYDGANFFEGTAAAPTLSNTTAALRANGGCVDTDTNGADFTAGTPTPRNSVSPLTFCAADAAPSIAARAPAAGATNVAVASNVTVTFSEPVDVTGAWYSLSCSTSGTHTATVSGGPTTYTIDPDSSFATSETCTVTVFAAQVSDQDTIDPPDRPTADDTWTFTTEAPPTAIHDIQGASHISPKVGRLVSGVQGIVTARTTNGFWMQDPNPDADPATSEGIFVFTSSAPSVAVGDAVRVNGRVNEFRPGGSSTGNLTTTELGSPVVTVVSSGNPLPAPIVVGNGGRIPPNTVLEDDATGNVETSGVFDPANDGLDFWESLEGMRIQLNNAVAVGPTNAFGETQVVGDDGANAGIRTVRGGILLRPDDANPERVVADDALTPLPALNVGDHYTGPLVGVLDYNFGNFFLEVTQPVDAVHDGVTRETTTPAGPNELSVATFNVENLAPSDPASKFDRLAGLFVHNLGAPDIVSVEEVQDSSGATDNGVVDAEQTLAKLVEAIAAAGGPTYEYRQIDPVNDADGGQPGGNIRQVFLFRTDRGVAFVDRPGGSSTSPVAVVDGPDGPELSASPGRIDPANTAWTSSRKPLAGEFTFNGHHLFVIANHFNSKGGDDPLEGRFQPPTRSSEVQRHQQAQLVHDFVAAILAEDPNANIVVDGDLNDFEFSDTVSILTAGGVLHDLVNTLPLDERYSYEFEGNAQVLDHILLSGGLFDRSPVYDVVHVNSEFADQASDHDPSVVRIPLAPPPTVSAGGPYGVPEGGTTTLTAAAQNGTAPLAYAWDLDGDGTFETAGQSVSFTGVDGPAAIPVRVQVTDADGRTAAADAAVSVTNVAPTATFHAPSTVFGGSDIAVSFTDAADPSSVDTAAGFEYAFDCGAGFGAFSQTPSTTCPTSAVGTRTVRGAIRDKDGGVTEYAETVAVVVTFDSLCRLVRQYSTNAGVADGLCAKLAAAADARARGSAKAAENQLNAFANQVDAQTGKALTPQQAATLLRLGAAL